MEKDIRDHSVAPSTPPTSQNGTGYLLVHVATAGGAIPLEGAMVDIRIYQPESQSEQQTRGDTVASLVSGPDGNTVRIPLSAPPKALSESPNTSETPYALYSAIVTLDGYYSQSYVGIPIFDGISSIQPVILIPLPENGTQGLPRENSIRFFEGMSADL
ncbi:MAG: hypothetical protein IKC59_01975 [Clostridia bacterium]|nr:hypothetical protein [Clostridia bacterium]